MTTLALITAIRRDAMREFIVKELRGTILNGMYIHGSTQYQFYVRLPLSYKAAREILKDKFNGYCKVETAQEAK